MWFHPLHPASTMVSFLVCLTSADEGIQTARWIISRGLLLVPPLILPRYGLALLASKPAAVPAG